MQVFDADIFNAPGPGISFDAAAAQAFVNRGRDRRVHGDEIAFDGFDDSIPNEIAAAGFPNEAPVADAAAKVGHAQAIDPDLGAWADDVDSIAGFQSEWLFDVEGCRADGDVVVGDLESA